LNKFTVLNFQIEPFGLRGGHIPVFKALFLKAGATQAVFATNLFDWHTGFGLPKTAHELRFAVSAFSHAHRSP
jgi:hypothetical protein